jgi:hypothetical protein
MLIVLFCADVDAHNAHDVHCNEDETF